MKPGFETCFVRHLDLGGKSDIRKDYKEGFFLWDEMLVALEQCLLSHFWLNDAYKRLPEVFFCLFDFID